MPWCPICKNEYQDGIKICADCGAELVEELEEERVTAVVAYIAEEELAGKFVDYLGYSKIIAEYAYSEKEESYAVTVDEADLEQAKVAFRAFYSVETKNQMLKDIEKLQNLENAADDGNFEFDEEILESIPDDEMSEEEKATIAKAVIAEQVYKPAEAYVKKADESKDMFSTAITFLGFAVLLLVFLVLNALDIITMFNNAPSLIMLGAMAVGCCLVGINAIKRSRRAEADSVEEEKLTEALNKWLDENITDDLFAELDEQNLSEEILYLRRTEIIQNKLNSVYPQLDDNYAEAMIEEFYNRRFENQEASETFDEETEGDDEASEQEEE